MIKVPSEIRRSASPEVKIDRFGGEDKSTTPTQIATNRAEQMVNMMLDTQGMLQQVPGFRNAISGTVSAGTTPVRMVTKNATSDKLIKSHGGKIYSFTPGGEETEIHSPITDAKMFDFIMGSHQYFGNGTDFIRWAGTGSFETVETVAYIPTTVIGRLPTGGGTVFEAVNLLQPKRKNSFVGDGTTKIFQLDTIGLDATLLTATVSGLAMVETTHFTVNRTTGAVTFITAPANGAGVDNTIIEFAKTVTGYANRIKNCQFFTIFGVGNNLRVFMSGNPNFKNWDWYSAMQDPTYWPDLNYTKIGSEGVAIKGYALQQGVMHILKEDSTYDPTIWTRTADTATDNTLYFPVRQNNSQIGLLATDTVKVVNDVPMILTKKGAYRITSTYVADERGLEHFSQMEDSLLLKESNLKNAIAFDFDGRYGIAINGTIYVFDYNNGFESYRWVGYPVSCFYEYDGNLYFGDSASGSVYVMNKIDDNDNTNMLGDLPIESYWYSKMLSMDRANYYKMIDTIAITLIPASSRSNVDIYYRTNKKTEKFIKKISVLKFDLNDLDLDNFGLIISDLPQTVNREINISDIIYFQVILKNSEPGMGMAISNITIPYSMAGEI